MTRAPKPAPIAEYLSLSDLCARFGVSHMWVRARIADRGFPRGVFLGGGAKKFWKRAEVEAWENNQANHPVPALNVEPGR